MAEVAVPVAVAAPEGEDLGKKCNQRMKLHWKNKKRKERERERKRDKLRFPNTPVGTFGWQGGATNLLAPTTEGA
jgi:hypothetical protein